MLTRELAIAAFDRGRVVPDRLTTRRHAHYAGYAEKMLGVYRSGLGRTRRELHQSVRGIFAGEPDCPYRRIDAFCKLLDDASVYDGDRRGTAAALRQRVFRRAAAMHPLVREADQVYEQTEASAKSAIAAEIGLVWDEIETRLFADVMEFHRLREFAGYADGRALLSRYNVAQVQAALFDAREMIVWASDDLKTLLRYAKLARLLHTIRRMPSRDPCAASAAHSTPVAQASPPALRPADGDACPAGTASAAHSGAVARASPPALRPAGGDASPAGTASAAQTSSVSPRRGNNTIAGGEAPGSPAAPDASPERAAESPGVRRGCDTPIGVRRGSDAPIGVRRGSDAPIGVRRGSDAPIGVRRGSDAPIGVRRGSDAPAGEMYEIRFDGPASVLRRTRRYGAAMAKFLPALLACKGWRMRATLETRRPGWLAALDLSPKDGLRTHLPPPEEFDSSIEEAFAAKWGSERREGWEMIREGGILHRDQKAFVPDFLFRHEDGREVHLEIVGYWTPEYLEAKRKTLELFADRPILLAVAEKLAEAARPLEASAGTIWFKTALMLEPVLSRLRELPVFPG